MTKEPILCSSLLGLIVNELMSKLIFDVLSSISLLSGCHVSDLLLKLFEGRVLVRVDDMEVFKMLIWIWLEEMLI